MATPVNEHGAPAVETWESLYIQIMRLLPKNSLSRLAGMGSDIYLPRSARGFVYNQFARIVGAKVEEAEHPVDHYPCLDAFFTRRLRPGLRPICEEPGAIVSPVDGRISQIDRIRNGEMVQVKGRTYKVSELLGSSQEAARFEGGHYATIYLSPRDYHRVHFPSEGKLLGYQYHPGHLFPVNPASVKQVDRLFCINERVCVSVDALEAVHNSQRTAGEDSGDKTLPTEGWRTSIILVGASCVGRMTLSFDRLETNRPGAQPLHVEYERGSAIERGDELGMFHLGSTVILLWEPHEYFTWAQGLRVGDSVQMGQLLANI